MIGSRKPVLLISRAFASAHQVEYCFEADPGAKDELLTRIQSLGIGSIVSGEVKS
jgi:hypothetical protein